MAGEAGRRGVGDVGGHNQPCRIAGPLGSLENGAAGLVLGRDGDGAVVALLAARKGRGPSGAVGDERVGGARAAGAPEVLVEQTRKQGPCRRRP
ncbi:hypothetical protein HYQ46_006542 [Verticillium longisporum]|nr:hypothetical protein HYQ46_006542 [Verticillium longisporum]